MTHLRNPIPSGIGTQDQAELGSGSVWIRANVEVPPRGFHDYACQCIRGRIHKKDEIESLRVVLAVNRNRTGQKDENPPDAVRTERIRESY
jgi:hypothetical protein